MNPSSEAHRRILVIDDNQAIHEDFRKIFGGSSEGEAALSEAETALFDEPASDTVRIEFKIDSAFQGQEGLALVQKAQKEDRPYSLIFVDGRMPPGWDGIETTSRIWDVDPEVQIVICTAYSDYSWDEMVAKLPKSDQLLILKKPFDTIEVLQMANALTEKWRLHHAVKFKMDFLQLNVDARTRVLEEENAKLKMEIESLKKNQK
jgi:DNA-binding LytR/AlgR family response regulator